MCRLVQIRRAAEDRMGRIAVATRTTMDEAGAAPPSARLLSSTALADAIASSATIVYEKFHIGGEVGRWGGVYSPPPHFAHAAGPMTTGQDVELFNPPEDGVSAVRFAPGSDDLLASSWDKVGAASGASQRRCRPIAASTRRFTRDVGCRRSGYTT